MKLEAGMCVRTDEGIITKIIDNRDNVIIKTSDYTTHLRSKVIKASHNIIDLIEVGDVITFKEDEDVYKIIGVPNEKYACKFFHLAKEFDGGTEDIIVGYGYMKESINSIVTKEQFESVQYKVSE